MTLDRTQVVEAAIDLLDEVGLDGLTLRRLAKNLGVQAPALYWHFQNKQELLDQMATTISAAETPRQPEAGEPWDDWLAERARGRRASLNRHRDGAMLAASARTQPERWREVDSDIAVLVDARMTAADALQALLAVDAYVSGFVLDEQADRLGATSSDGAETKPADGIDATPSDGAETEQLEPALDAFADYPRLTGALREVGEPRSGRSFEAGLRVILDGLRQRMQRAANSAGAAAE